MIFLSSLASLIFFLGFIALLLGICWMDLKAYIIPNKLIIGLFVLWLIGVVCDFNFQSFSFDGEPNLQDLIIQSLAGAFLLGGGSYLLWWIQNFRGKKSSIGGGDVKLLAMLGLYIGFRQGLIALVLACAMSLLIYTIPTLLKKISGFPFAPMLTMGTMFSYLL